jgi:hypothetical protein
LFQHLADAHPKKYGGPHQQRNNVTVNPPGLKDDDFPPLACLDAQTRSPPKPVSALTAQKRFDDDVLKAKKELEAAALRREQLKVEGRRRENELRAAELQELPEVRKGHHHSLPNCWPPHSK